MLDFNVAISMLLHKPLRMFVTVVGMSCLYFLTTSQVGMVIGWCNTVSALVRFSGADYWLVSPGTNAYDYGTPLPSSYVHRCRSVHGVQWAEGLYMDWAMWKRPDGKRISVEVVGIDSELKGGPWELALGSHETLFKRDSVIVDEAYCMPLGVTALGDEFELFDQKVTVTGVSRNVRTFTASPFVFLSLKTARELDERYRADEVTYVLVKSQPGCDRQKLFLDLQNEIPEAVVMTSHQFSRSTILYWMVETGVGLTTLLTAVLAALVTGVVVSQTVFQITQENAANYATLLALGFRRMRIFRILACQTLFLAILSWIGGTVLFTTAAWYSVGSTVPLEMDMTVYIGLTLTHLTTCGLASIVSGNSIFSIDPVTVFRG